MARAVITSGSVTSAIAKTVEFVDAYSINGHMYAKDKVTPIPLSFCFIPSSDENESTFSKYARLPDATFVSGSNVEQGVVNDKYLPDISYILAQGKTPGMNYIYKIKKVENTYTKIGSYAINVSYRTDSDIVGQDINYIYVRSNYLTTGTAASVLYKINKATMAVDTSCIIASTNLFYNTVTLHPEIISGKMYGCMIINSSGKMTWFYVDLATMTMTSIAGTTVFTNPRFTGGTIVKEDNTLSMYFIGNSGFIHKTTLNLSALTVTELQAATYTYNIAPTNTSYVVTRCININNKAIVVLQRCLTSAFSNLDNKVSSFKINTDGTLTLINTISLGVDTYANFLYSKVDSLIFLLSQYKNNVLSIATDDDYRVMLISSMENADLHTFAKDTAGQYFSINKDCSHDIFNPEIPIKLEVTYDKTVVGYDGSSQYVYNNMTIKMYTHLGKLVSGTVKVTLIGPAQFTDGATTKQFAISGSTTIPFRISGPGDIDCKVINI